MRKVLWMLILLCSAAWGQSNRDVTFLNVGPTLPSSCSVGQSWILTSGVIGVYGCTSANTWTGGGPLALADTPLTTRGDLLVVNSTPALARLALAAANLYIKSNGTDTVYSTLAAAGVGTPTACTNQFVTGFTLNADAAPVSTCTSATASNVGLGNVTNDAQTKAAIVPNTAPSAGQVLAGNAGGTAYAPVSLSSDCTLASTGAITCTKTNGTNISTLTNAAGSNVIPKSNGTNLVASSLSDDATTVSTTEKISSVLSTAGAGGSNATIAATATTFPAFGAVVSGASSTNKNYDILFTSTTAALRALADDNSSAVNAWVCNRSGVAWTSCAFSTTLNANGNPLQGYTTISSSTNCSAAGSAANPSVAACTAAPSGAFSCATNASAGTCQVNTTAVTTNSDITLTQVSSDSTRLGVTCNVNALTSLPVISAKNNGVSFTVTLGAFVTNPLCFHYTITN